MVGEYGGDHLDLRGGDFKGPVVTKGNFYQQAAAPTALDALPARAAGFTGRDDELGRLLDALDPSAAGGGSVPVLVAALSGLGGVGKTALAVEAAHRACAKGWFPGGVLFLDLHGYDDDPVTGEQALEALLRALGVEPEHIPVRADERGALFRSLLAERGRERGAVLVVADNASSPDQVRPLLPGDVRHRLLVTSRSKLPQLGARLLALGELAPQEAYELLDRALRIADPADSRIAGEAEAAMRLARRCGQLPLALQIAAALLVLDGDRPVAELAAGLSESRDRLAHLDDGERSVRAAFDLSYRRLPADQARLLRLLALAPGAEVTEAAVTALTGEDVPPSRTLAALTRAHLVERGSRRGRWRLHDLVRAFGAGVVAGDPELRKEGEAARERVLDFYVRWVTAADDRLRWLPGTAEPERFADRAEALAWLDGERAGLVAAVSWGREKRFASRAVRLAQCLRVYLDWRRHFDDLTTVMRTVLEVAHRAGDRHHEATAWTSLGLALREADRVAEAIEAHTRARDLFRADGDCHREAAAWNNLGLALRAADRVAEAMEAHRRARDLSRAEGDRHGEATAWNNLGLALRKADRVAEAIEAHTRARDLFRADGDRHGEATAWNNLGLALEEAGRVADEIAAYGKALEIHREFEDWHRAGVTLGNLAVAHEDARLPADAHAYWLQAADAYTQAQATNEAAIARARAAAVDGTPQAAPPVTP
ncbi:tetratricopeptide repeat protein [Streptomyces curacoi]|uniref:Regulator n=1 Tax=Streptomyces curacoi TaxID=146536 RepID=A0A124GXG7_9ACTN|nr:tetratricopeptide repeat protein [Streptomyces curacoi]KUM70925.1 regulator [Streptomyces curacoi]